MEVEYVHEHNLIFKIKSYLLKLPRWGIVELPGGRRCISSHEAHRVDPKFNYLYKININYMKNWLHTSLFIRFIDGSPERWAYITESIVFNPCKKSDNQLQVTWWTEIAENIFYLRFYCPIYIWPRPEDENIEPMDVLTTIPFLYQNKQIFYRNLAQFPEYNTSYTWTSVYSTTASWHLSVTTRSSHLEIKVTAHEVKLGSSWDKFKNDNGW